MMSKLKSNALPVCAAAIAGAAVAVAVPAFAQDGDGGFAAVQASAGPPPMFAHRIDEDELAKLEQERQEFEDCMQEQGLDLPDPPDPRQPGEEPGGAGDRFEQRLPAPSHEFRKAVEECGGPPVPPHAAGMPFGPEGCPPPIEDRRR